jgi:mannose-6-phosphate isomerase-like protein (cupin superfamily)
MTMRNALGVGVGAIALCAFASPVVLAQTPAPVVSREVQIIPATRLSMLSDSLSPGALRSMPLGRFENLTNALTTRDTSGTTEIHDQQTDIFVAQKGRARLRYGGTATGQREVTPGEWRGGTTTGGTERELNAGDVVVIPAGIPHQLLIRPGERFAYLAFKVNARKITP